MDSSVLIVSEFADTITYTSSTAKSLLEFSQSVHEPPAILTDIVRAMYDMFMLVDGVEVVVRVRESPALLVIYMTDVLNRNTKGILSCALKWQASRRFCEIEESSVAD